MISRARTPRIALVVALAMGVMGAADTLRAAPVRAEEPALPGDVEGRCAEGADPEAAPAAPCLDARSGLVLHPRIAFEIDKARIRPASVPDVRALAAFLTAHAEISWLEIRVHSDVPPGTGGA